jgi:serine O-acetyltransferase
MDLHPGAKFGRGVLIDHATGIVVGETSVVEDDCSLFHGVTLGGTGKTGGNRHPKLQKRVVVGAHASVIGNITIGHDCKIGASSTILHDLPPHSVVVGHKGRVILDKSKVKSDRASLLSKL